MSTTSPVSHVPITQAAPVALLATLTGEAVALVPAWAPEKSLIIQIGTFAIAIAFLIANAIHAHAAKASAPIPITPQWGTTTATNAASGTTEFQVRKVVTPTPTTDEEGWPV